MSETTAFSTAFMEMFIDWLYSGTSSKITVPTNYYTQCNKIRAMINNDITGVINTILDYSVNAVSNINYSVECPNNNFQDFLNHWLSIINIDVDGVISGLHEIQKEYGKERWQGSSLIILKGQNWKEIKYKGISLEMPTVFTILEGSAIYVDRKNTTLFEIGSDKYKFNVNGKPSIRTAKDDIIIVQKPFNRMVDRVSTPYCIRKGIYKHYKTIEQLQSKGDSTIEKVLPYLLEMLIGDDKNKPSNQQIKDVTKEMADNMKSYNVSGGKTPLQGFRSDVKLQHLIPDIRNMVSEDLFKYSMRALMAGLGFVTVVEGLGSTRKEEVINPKPFIYETTSGADDFGTMLKEVIMQIAFEKQETNSKYFADRNEIRVIHSPLKINLDAILDAIRSGYDRGLSIQSYIESLGFDYKTERERRIKEYFNGDENIFYPHLINNQEEKNERNTPARDRKEIPEDRKPGSPESTKFKSEFDETRKFITAPYDSINELPASVKKLPKEAQRVFMTVFNSAYKQYDGDEARSFATAWKATTNWLRKHGYKKNKDGDWIKK